MTSVATVQGIVRSLVTVPLLVREEAALISLSYNIGTGALRTSTLLHLLNLGNKAGAAGQFILWDHAAGVVVNGLLTRRSYEQAVFLGTVVPA